MQAKAPTPTRPESPPESQPEPRLNRWLRLAALALALFAGLASAAEVAAGSGAGRAAGFLLAGDSASALAAADAALEFYPWQVNAFETRCLALRRLGRWSQLQSAAQAAMAWIPDPNEMDLMAGQAAFEESRAAAKDAAAGPFWRYLWQSPRPKFNAAQLWRGAMLSGAAAWGRNDPRVAVAAIEALRLSMSDAQLDEADRSALRIDATAALKGAGAPQTAERLSAETSESKAER